MGSTGNLAPPPSIESPIPQPTVQVQTAQDVGLKPPPPVPSVYYGSEAGGIAHVADSVLTGWMAGKKLKEDKLRQNAAENIGAAKSAVDVIGQNYRTAVENGDQDKIASTKQALQAAWKNYVGQAEQYVQPPPGDKKGLKDKAKQALLPNSPQLYQQATLDILKQTDPTSMYGPSKKEQLQQKAAEGQIAEQGTRQKLEDLSLDQQTKINGIRNDYMNAVANGDVAAQQKASQGLNAYGQKVELPSEQQLRQQVTQSALDGMKELQSGKNFAQLSDLQRSAMVKEGIAAQVKNGPEAYQAEVGPNKRFKTEYDAQRQYLIDERTSRVMGMKPTLLEDLRNSQKIILQHDLQDPATAKQYGIDPLKPGQQPPQWLVEKEAEKRYKENSEDKNENKIYSDIAVNKITTKALNTFSPVEQEAIKSGFLSKDDDTGLSTLNPNPDFNNVPGMNADQAQTLYNSFRNRSKTWYSELYPGADEATIEKRLGPAPAGAGSGKPSFTPPPATMNQKRGGSDSTGLLPPPSVNAAPSYPPNASYTVSKGGKTLYGGQAIQMTAAQAQKAASGGFVIQQSK